jgi:hypothetical protein
MRGREVCLAEASLAHSGLSCDPGLCSPSHDVMAYESVLEDLIPVSVQSQARLELWVQNLEA